MSNFFLVSLFCCVVGAHSACLQAPVGKLPEGCKIGNLQVYSLKYDDGVFLIDGTRKCNSKATFRRPDEILQIAVSLLQDKSPSSDKTYLVTAVDRTAKRLILMESNITVNTNDLIVYPRRDDYYRQVIIPYRPPEFEHSSADIEFLIFEEHRRSRSSSYRNYKNAIHVSPFDLSTWVDSQKNSGITICGPVAGGNVVVNLSHLDPEPDITNHVPSVYTYQNDFPQIKFDMPNNSDDRFTTSAVRLVILIPLLIIKIFLARRSIKKYCCCCNTSSSFPQDSSTDTESILGPGSTAIPMPWPGYPPKSTSS